MACRDLRKAVLPVLFRNVTLKLRWVNGALAEPGLLRLREQCPQLAKYARCVYVATHFGHFRDPRSTMGSFSIPKELQHWLECIAVATRSPGNNASSACPRISNEVAAEMLLATSQCRAFLSNADGGVQARFRDLAYSLSEQVIHTPGVFSLGDDSSSSMTDVQGLLGDETFFDDVREEARSPAVTEATGRTSSRDLRFKLDAFFVILLCFPFRLTSLVFESLPTDRMDILQNKFALHFAGQIFKIYGSQLRHLTMKTTRKGAGHSSRANDDANPQLDILNDAISGLEAIQQLCLAAQHSSSGARSVTTSLGHWHMISEQITHLDIRNATGDASDFVRFIEKFTNLKRLTLGDFKLWVNQPRRATPPSHATFWLSFLIDLRRKLPDVEFDIRDPELSQAKLTESGVRWLLQEAVPTGAIVDLERETRLVEDFESFFLLWSVEDGQRGRDAEEARKDGKLVDLAMSSRWRGLSGGSKR